MTLERGRAAAPAESLSLRSPAMDAVSRIVARVAATDLTVLLVGETGVGKEVVAAAMHRQSGRNGKPFLAINCGALPEALVCTTLFGHENGSFTGSTQTTKGLFELVAGGTLLLDEVAELSASAQSALLRVLETRRFFPVGSQCERTADVRVLAATHRDLASLAHSGAFRRDLWYRLSGFVIEVPPLRARREDIVPLARYFLRDACLRLSVPEMRFTEEVIRTLESYEWPGNVRELRNAVDRAVVMADSGAITAESLPSRIPGSRTNQAEISKRLINAAYHDRVREYEIRMILDGLKRCRGNQTKAASLLGIPLRTLVHKMRSFGLREGNLAADRLSRRI